MATYDNKHWLLSHIRNSFICTDDTGMCEMVMMGEDLPRLLRAGPAARGEVGEAEWETHNIMDVDCYPDMDQSDEDDMDPLTESYDLQHDMDFGMHRRERSNTAQRLEKMDIAQRKAAKIKMVKWENPSSTLSEQERSQLFSRKELIPTCAPRRSKLSEQLDKCPFMPQTQFLEFARLDGTAQIGLPTKTYKIFMNMVPDQLKNYPIIVCIVASACIRELIGFTCYKYSIVHPEVILGPVSTYGLYISEDDGEVDWDFPPLDIKESCSKFGFTCLGLVDLKSSAATKSADMHSCSIPEKGDLNTIILPEDRPADPPNRSRSATLDSRAQTKNAAKNAPRSGRAGPVGSSSVTFGDEAGRRQDADFATDYKSAPQVSNTKDLGTSSSPQETEGMSRMKHHELTMEAPQYQSFRVRLATRLRAGTPVLLGVSGQRLELDSLQSQANKFWPRMKPVSYPMESVAWCELVESRGSRTTFRLVYSPQHAQPLEATSAPTPGSSAPATFKHHDFECEAATARAVVEKVNRILELQSSACRQEYRAARERKRARRSFHLPRNV